MTDTLTPGIFQRRAAARLAATSFADGARALCGAAAGDARSIPMAASRAFLWQLVSMRPVEESPADLLDFLREPVTSSPRRRIPGQRLLHRPALYGTCAKLRRAANGA